MTRPMWADRIARAARTWEEWPLLPTSLRLDKAFKAAGFRDLVMENHELRAALKHIADWPDDNMATAKTLHYDMRGWARDALAE